MTMHIVHTPNHDDPLLGSGHPVTAPPRYEEQIGNRDLGHWHSTPGRWLARQVAALAARVGIRSAAGVVLLVGALVTGLLAVLASRVYDSVADQHGISTLDQPTLEEAMSLRNPGLNHAVTVFTDIGGPTWMPVVSAVLAAVVALSWRTWLPVLLTLVATAGSLAMTIAGKDLVGRVRPPLADVVPPFEHSPSFPSGHTLNTTVVLGVLTYVVLTRVSSRPVRALAVVAASAWVIAMGLSRVYLGHHWLTDVAMGWVLGLTWVTALVTVHRAWITARRHREALGAAGEGRTGGGGGSTSGRSMDSGHGGLR